MTKRKQSRFTLAFKGQLEKRYMLTMMDQDLFGFKLIFRFLFIANPLFILLEFFRSEDPAGIITSRLILQVFIVLILFLGQKIKQSDFLKYQVLFMASSIIIYLHLIFSDYMLQESIYELFLPNLTRLCLFINASFIGLRFRYSIITNIILMTMYVLYAESISTEPLHASQIPSMVMFFIVSVIVSYLLEKKNREIFRNTQLIAEQNELIKSNNEELSKQNELKNSLISILSHDIKGPLTGLQGILKLSERKVMTEIEAIQHFDKVRSSLDKVIKFTSRMILWIKSQMGGFKVNLISLNIHDQINQIIDLSKEQAHLKGVTIKNKIPGSRVIQTDLEMTTTVVRNLLTNAIKFSKIDGYITLSDCLINNHYQIHLQDNGVGIPKNRLSTLFHLDGTTTFGTKNEEGTGLGLPLSYNLMKQIGGDLEVESEEDSGTLFKIIFQKSAVIE